MPVRRTVSLLAVTLLLFTGGLAWAESTLVLTYEDPCPMFAAMGRDQMVGVAGLKVSLEPLYFGTCTYLKEQINTAIDNKMKSIQGEFEAAAQGAAQEVYVDFQHWLKEIVAARLGMNPNDPKFEPHFQEWLNHPDKEIEFYVNAFLNDQYPRIHELVRRCQQDNSREMISGLHTLWKEAKDRLNKLTQAYKQIEADPKADYTKILRDLGFSGSYLVKFKSYEQRFNAFNSKYRIVEAAKVLYEAFEAKDHRGKIGGLFKLLETVGDIAYRSDIPGVSLFGQIIKAYGQVANEMLEQVNALERLIREREGFCIGLATHTIEEERNKAFIASFGRGIRICPMDPKRPILKDIYQQAQPGNVNQLYFWIEKKGAFVKGSPTGGGIGAVRKAQEILRGAEEIGFTELKGKDTDLATIAAFYNTPFNDKKHGNGLNGLWQEAVTTINGIASRLGALGRGLAEEDGAGCSSDKLYEALERECRVNARVFPRHETQVRKLQLSYALGYIAEYNPQALPNRRSVNAYERYLAVWQCLKPMSVLIIEGKVRRSGSLNEPCLECGDALISLRPFDGYELPGCEVGRADALGKFSTRVYTWTPNLSIRIAAFLENGLISEVLTIDRRSVKMEPFPFIYREFHFTVPVRFPEEEQTPEPEAERTPPPSPTPRPMAIVPNLVGKTLDEVSAALTAADLRLGASSGGDPAPTASQSYSVQSQAPESGVSVDPRSFVAVVIYDRFQAAGITVPNVVGLNTKAARKIIREAGLNAQEEITDRASSAATAFTVYAQAPLPGTVIERWGEVHLKAWGAFREEEPIPEPTPIPAPPRPTPRPQADPTPRPPTPTPGTGIKPGTIIIDQPPPDGPNWDLAGRWDTTRGVVFDMKPTGPNTYNGILVRVYKKDKYYHLVPGDRGLSAVRSGPNHYQVKTHFKYPNGKWSAIGPILVIVDGETARAGRLVWKRVNTE